MKKCLLFEGCTPHSPSSVGRNSRKSGHLLPHDFSYFPVLCRQLMAMGPATIHTPLYGALHGKRPQKENPTLKVRASQSPHSVLRSPLALGFSSVVGYFVVPHMARTGLRDSVAGIGSTPDVSSAA